MMVLKIENLNKRHNKSSFHCGNPLLDNYIKRQANQDIPRDLSACSVLIESSEDTVIGYYTLSANSISRDNYQTISPKLPPGYKDLPTILLGRLAIDNKYQGNGYGELILMDALNKCVDISAKLGILAVVVDPKDVEAQSFYKKYGFILLPGTGKMFIPIKTIENTL